MCRQKLSIFWKAGLCRVLAAGLGRLLTAAAVHCRDSLLQELGGPSSRAMSTWPPSALMSTASCTSIGVSSACRPVTHMMTAGPGSGRRIGSLLAGMRLAAIRSRMLECQNEAMRS